METRANHIWVGAVTLALLSQMNDRRGTVYYAVGLDGLLLVQAALILAIT